MEKLSNEFKIEFTKGDTYALAIKFKNITEDLRLAYFSVKDNPDDAPLIQKSLGAGIDKIDDRDYKNEKTYKFQLQPADTVNLEAQTQYLYDIQVTIGNVVKTVLHGVFTLRNTITGTSSVTASNLEIEVDDEVETEFTVTPATNGVEYEQDPVALAKIGDLTLLATTVKDSLVQAINEVKNGVTTNANDLYKIKNGTLKVPKAKNAESADDTTKINGILATEIFEENGKVVKNATSAGKSANVYAKIGGIPIKDIFEIDGTTVKKATTADGISGNVVYEGPASFSSSADETKYPNKELPFELEVGYKYQFVQYSTQLQKTFEGVALKESAYADGSNPYCRLSFIYHFSGFLEQGSITSTINSGKTNLSDIKRITFNGESFSQSYINAHYEKIKVIKLEKVFDDE